MLKQFTIVACLGLMACAPTAPAENELEEAAAVEIARQEVSFEPQTVKTERLVEEGRKVWRVTFRGEPGPPPLVPIMIVTLDRMTGEVVSLARD